MFQVLPFLNNGTVVQEVKGQKEETTGRSTEVKTFLYFNAGANSGNCLSCRSHDVTAITLRSNKGNCTAPEKKLFERKTGELGSNTFPSLGPEARLGEGL